MTKNKMIHLIAFCFLTVCYPMFVIGLMVDSLKMFAACGGVGVYLHFTVLMSYDLWIAPRIKKSHVSPADSVSQKEETGKSLFLFQLRDKLKPYRDKLPNHKIEYLIWAIIFCFTFPKPFVYASLIPTYVSDIGNKMGWTLIGFGWYAFCLNNLLFSKD